MGTSLWLADRRPATLAHVEAEGPRGASSRRAGPPLDASGPWPAWLWRGALALILVGVAWRSLRYLLQFPIWGDEAFVALSLLDRNYLGLTRPLRYVQVAPVLFLWVELTAYRLLGGSELALRLFPFLAGLGALALFWRFVRSSLSPLAGGLALGILAVSYYPVRHSCEIKPYALDLLASLALLVTAAKWLREPNRRAWPLLLTVLGPLAVASSYPSIFIAGSISLVLLPAVAPQPGWKPWARYAAYNVTTAAAFLAAYSVVGSRQYASAGGTGNPFWDAWFPPAGPVALLKWLAAAHTGNLFAYPVGGRGGGSVATFLLCMVGVWHLARTRQGRLLALCALPFGFTLSAAALRLYPYGGSARVAQHLAPAICALAGIGAAALIARLAPSILSQRRAVLVAFGGLALVGIGGMGRDVMKPYKTESDARVREIAAQILAQAGPDDQIVVLNPTPASMPPALEWYLRQGRHRISWGGEIDRERLDTTTKHLWVFAFPGNTITRDDLEARLAAAKRRPLLADHATYAFHFGWPEGEVHRCEIFHWIYEPDHGARPPADLTHAIASTGGILVPKAFAERRQR